MHVVNRDRMISEVAEESGHRILNPKKIISFSGEELRLEDGETITAKIFAGCDGANSKVAAGLGLKRLVRVPAKQYLMKNVECDENSIYMYVGKRISPGGYAWIIPKGDGLANVGIGFVSSRAERGDTIRKALKRFVEEHPYSSEYLRKAEIVQEIGAVVPVDLPYQKVVYGNTVLLGDSAGMVISHVGAGIPTSMVAGELAGRIINECLEEDDITKLSEFDRLWKRSMLNPIKNGYLIKTLWDRISETDERLSRYLSIVSERDMWKILHSKIPLKLRLATFFIPVLNRIF
jgi:geranylgeranyl reductase family protein